MNKNQKIVLAIFVPIIIFFIALMIANSMGYTEITRKTPEGSYFRKYLGETTIYREGNPFDWGRTWGVWLVYSASCCLFEFLLFRDKKER
jgi:hypothetical protein